MCPRNMKRPLVLIVEDSASERDGLAALVRSEGFAVEAVENLGQARQRLEKRRPVLMICDHMLPDGLGGDFVVEVESEQGVATLLVTASVDAPELSDREFLPKPIDVAQLLDVLDEHRPLERS